MYMCYGCMKLKLHYCYCVNRDASNIVVNKVAGHMLRTKVCSANEGGVASGMGALDSVYLGFEETE